MRLRSLHLVLSLTLLAFVLRTYQLAAQSMWGDEIFGVAVARLGVPQFLDPVFRDRVHPPGFYLLMTFWSALGIQEFVTRYVPLAFGVATIPLVYRLGRQVASKWVGVASAFLLAFSPFHLWYSQEARMYAPLAFVASASVLLFLRVLSRPRRRDVILYGATSAAGLYLHQLYPLVLLAQLVFVVLKRRTYARALAPWLMANVVAGAMYLPWLAAILLTGGYATAGIDWIPAANWYDPALSLYSLSLGPANDPGAWWTWVTPLLLGILALVGLRCTDTTRDRERAQLLAIWFGLPLTCLLLVSLPLPFAQKRSIYLDRFMIQLVPALFLLAAWGAERVWRRRPRALLILACIGCVPAMLSIRNNYSMDTYARDDWRAAAEMIRGESGSANTRLILNADMVLPYGYYDRANLPRSVIPDPGPPDYERWLVNELDTTSPEHVWLIRTTNPPNVHLFAPSRQAQLDRARRDPLKAWLDTRWRIEREQWFHGMVVTEYQQ